MEREGSGGVFRFGEKWIRSFSAKGKEGGPHVPQAGDANGVKVRRVLQVTEDLAPASVKGLRILDAGCGEGVYAIEAALRGAHVVALDARTERMSRGAACADEHGISNLEFRQEDIRDVRIESHGEFDVVYLLGILYHLDTPDVFHLLENLYALCRRFMIVDTFVALSGEDEAEHRGRRYAGRRVREHEDSDSAETRRARLLRSIDNTFAFRFMRESLGRLLGDVGFTSVYECLGPPEPFKPSDRITLVAHRGKGVSVSTYPWINGLSEREIEERLRERGDGDV